MVANFNSLALIIYFSIIIIGYAYLCMNELLVSRKIEAKQ